MSFASKSRLGFLVITCCVAGLTLVSRRPGTKPPVKPVYHPWVITTSSPNHSHGTYLGNGFIAARIGNEGWGTNDGARVGCYMAGLYSDETLAELPHWSGVEIIGSSGSFRIYKDLPYRQSLDMQRGQVRTRYSMRSDRDVIDVDVLFFISRVRPGVAVTSMRIRPRRDMRVLIASPIGTIPSLLRRVSTDASTTPKAVAEADSRVSVRTPDGATRVAVVSGITPPKGLRISRERVTRGTRWLEADLKEGRSYTFVKMTAILRDGRYGDPMRAALQTLSSARSIGPGRLLAEHEEAWRRIWQADIKIEGDPEAQQVVHSCMFYLLQSVRKDSDWSIPPTGITSTAWNGHVFWDADTWMFPALLPQHPELAKSIVDYRFKTLSGARANARKRGLAGVEYAWESAMTGRESISRPFSEERHINADVALAQWQYYLATGNLTWLRWFGYPVIRETANYWVSRAQYNKAQGRHEIRRVMPPDEIVEIIDNSVYTNAAAKRNLEVAIEARHVLGRPGLFAWRNLANTMYLPFDKENGRYVEYDGYGGQRTKQADTELLIYPLQIPMPVEVAQRTFDYYKGRVMPRGPAMSTSVHAVIAARLGRRDEAYTNFRKSYKPYLRGPFNMYNETPSRVIDHTCFLTGAGGTLQSVIYGFGGLDIAADQIKAKPLLPKQWKRLAITNIKWRGRAYDLVVEPTGYRLRKVSPAISSRNTPNISRKVASPH